MSNLSYFDLFFKPLDASCDVSQFHSTEQEQEFYYTVGTIPARS